MTTQADDLFEDYGDAEAAEDKKKRESLDAGEWMRWEDGENWGRVMPPRKGSTKNSPFRIVKVHRIQVPGQKFKIVFKCLGPACPACEHGERLFKSPDPADKEIARELKAKATSYFYWINRDAPEMGPRKAQVTANVMQGIEKVIARYGSISNPVTGFDLCLEKFPAMSKNNQTSFPKIEVFAEKKPRPLGTNEEIALWASAIKDVDTLVPERSLDEIVKALRGEVADTRQVGGRERQQVGDGGRTRAETAPRGRTVRDDVISGDDDDL